jgi:hypothetical protein
MKSVLNSEIMKISLIDLKNHFEISLKNHFLVRLRKSLFLIYVVDGYFFREKQVSNFRLLNHEILQHWFGVQRQLMFYIEKQAFFMEMTSYMSLHVNADLTSDNSPVP